MVGYGGLYLPLSGLSCTDHMSFDYLKSLKPTAGDPSSCWSHPINPRMSLMAAFATASNFTPSKYGNSSSGKGSSKKCTKGAQPIGPVVDQQLLGRNDLLHPIYVSLIVFQAVFFLFGGKLREQCFMPPGIA